MEANRDEGRKCQAIARAALDAGDYEKAVRFAEKAVRLQGADLDARAVLEQARRAAQGTASNRTSDGAASAETTAPNGMGSSEGLRQRNAPSPSQQQPRSSGSRPPRTKEPPKEDDGATPEQRSLVSSIRSRTCYYEILSLPRSATDDDIKRAYRKLALKLHPDKNKAHGADEAFKKVSRAFTCLSDASKRRFYDAYGEDGESPAARAGFRGARQAGVARNGSFNMFFDDDIDPQEVFRMFFGGNPFMPSATRVYSYGYGGPQRRRQAQQQQHRGQGVHSSESSILRNLASLLPFVVLILVNLLSRPSQPPFSLAQNRQFPVPLSTATHAIPFFVPSTASFASKYPSGSRERTRLEMRIESEWRDSMQRACYQERLMKQRYEYAGQRRRAEGVSLASCEELTRRFAGGSQARRDAATAS